MVQFKKKKDYTSEELESAISGAIKHCHDFNLPSVSQPLDFWKICRGIDAYFEKRRRKEIVETGKNSLSRDPSSQHGDPSAQ